jgi:hypothetical protein
MDNKIFLLAGIFAVLLVSSGCIGKSPSTGIGSENYNIGTKGLEMSIIKNLPPDEIWKGSAFIIGVDLKNSGAYDINAGTVSISGFDQNYLEVQDSQTEFSLAGKQPGYPEGERNVLNFKAVSKGMPFGLEEYIGSLTVFSQYHYATEANAQICINPDIYNIIKIGSVCEAKTITFTAGQGAPVSVTSISSVLSPRGIDYDVSFAVTVKNNGPGRVLGNLIVKEAKLSNQAVQCKKEIEFNNKKDNMLACSISLKNLRSAYIAPFSLKLEYDYETSVDKKLTITDPLLESRKN